MLSLFAGLMIADKISKRWTVLAHITVYWLMIGLTIGSLIIYSGVIIEFGKKPAFKFLVVPLISWLLFVTAMQIVSRLPSDKSN